MLPTWPSVAAYKLEEMVFNFYHDTSGSNVVPPIIEAYRRLAKTRIPYNDHDKHHLFGHPEPVIQDDALFTVSRMLNGNYMDGYTSLEDLVLLLQISSDDLPQMLWGDTSSLYYCIRKQDLLAKQFDNVVCVHESY